MALVHVILNHVDDTETRTFVTEVHASKEKANKRCKYLNKKADFAERFEVRAFELIFPKTKEPS